MNEMEILSSQMAGRFGGGLYSSLIACICEWGGEQEKGSLRAQTA